MICSPNILSFNFSFNSELWLHWHHHLDTAVMQHCSTWHTAVAQTVIILVLFNVNYWTIRNWSLISKPFYTKKQKHLHDGTRLDYFILFSAFFILMIWGRFPHYWHNTGVQPQYVHVRPGSAGGQLSRGWAWGCHQRSGVRPGSSEEALKRTNNWGKLRYAWLTL